MSGYIRRKVIDLIKAHYSIDKDRFDTEALNIATYFANQGDYGVSESILMIVQGKPSIVPMERKA